MSLGHISSLVLLIIGIIWMYRGAKMLYQSKMQDKQITWYKRSKLTRGMYFLLLGLELIVLESANLTRTQVPFGDVGGFIILVFALLVVLFGVLSVRYKPHDD